MKNVSFQISRLSPDIKRIKTKQGRLNIMKNYLLCFCIGACSGYLISTLVNPEKNIASPVNITTSITPTSPNITIEKQQEVTVATEPLMTTKALSAIEYNTPTTSINSQKYVKMINELKYENAALQEKYQRSDNRMRELTLELESLDESEITDQQMIALIDDDFARYRRQFRGEQRDNIFNLHTEHDDLDWGFEMNTRLRDFIETHYHANSVVVQGATCKVNRCELLILEREAGIWSLVSKELTVQPWWKFSSMHSSSSSTDDEQKSFYLLLSI